MKKYRWLLLILAIFTFDFIRIHGVTAAQTVISNVVFPQPAATTPPMVYTTLSESASPDKTWKAKLYVSKYQGDYAFQTSFVVHLQIAPVSAPTQTHNVVSYDTGGNKANNPSFTWSGQHTLVVTTIHDEYLTRHEPSYSNVSIQYKYR